MTKCAVKYYLEDHLHAVIRGNNRDVLHAYNQELLKFAEGQSVFSKVEFYKRNRSGRQKKLRYQAFNQRPLSKQGGHVLSVRIEDV